MKGRFVRMTVVSIFDVCSGAYSRPVFTSSKSVAIRSFRDECLRVGAPDQLSDVQRHPEDFSLMFLGEFDDSTGKFEGVAMPELLFKGADCKGGV